MAASMEPDLSTRKTIFKASPRLAFSKEFRTAWSAALAQLCADRLGADILSDVQGALVGCGGQGLLPARADQIIFQEPEGLEGWSHEPQLRVGERRQEADHDGRSQAKVLGEAADEVLEFESLGDDSLADLLFVESIEAGVAAELEVGQTDVAVRASFLFPAEDFEESLGQWFVLALLGELDDGFAVAGSDQAFEQGQVLIAEAKPLPAC
jgi:hypothetical protein